MPIYHLILSPSHPVENVVNYYKSWLGRRIGDFIARYSKPHVTLAMFQMNVRKEIGLLHSMKLAAAEETPFSLYTHGFGFFDSSRTAYIQVEEKERFERLSFNLHEKTAISLLPSNCKSIVQVPHLTIAKNLTHTFEQACDLLKHPIETQTFTASAVTLLKKNKQEKSEILQVFPFLSKPSPQLTLF